MTIEQMRSEVALAYPGGAWAARVSRMDEQQIYAVYHRLSTTGKLEAALRERKHPVQPVYERQLSIFDKEFQAV